MNRKFGRLVIVRYHLVYEWFVFMRLAHETFFERQSAVTVSLSVDALGDDRNRCSNKSDIMSKKKLTFVSDAAVRFQSGDQWVGF
jgi:hypothetical protein